MNTMIGKLSSMTSVFMLVAALAGPTTTLAASPKPKPIVSGVVDVLDFDADWTQNMANGPIRPSDCQTDTHLAGQNEVAVINMAGFVAPSGAQGNNFLQLRVAVSENSEPFHQLLPGFPTIDDMSGIAAQVSISKNMALTAGVTYTFGAEFRTGYPSIVGFSTCHGTVTFLRLES